ncbi:hypothetical protein BHE74_00009603 [Ensete ventricosum]|nr:hypothetical protein BHE74_00009603 [Ensete ventricosum]
MDILKGTTFVEISTGKPSVSDSWTAHTIESGRQPAGIGGQTAQTTVGPPIPQITCGDQWLTVGKPPKMISPSLAASNPQSCLFLPLHQHTTMSSLLPLSLGVNFCTALPLHLVNKFISFLSIGGCSPVSLVVEVLLLSTASSSWLPDRCPFFLPYRCTPCNFLQQSSIVATISVAPFSIGSIIYCPRCLIPLPHPADAAALICPCSPGSLRRRSPLPLPTALLPASSMPSILRARSARPRFSCGQPSTIATSIASPLLLLCLPAIALMSSLQSPMSRTLASFLCLLVVNDVEGTTSSSKPTVVVLVKIQHQIDADLPDVVRPPPPITSATPNANVAASSTVASQQHRHPLLQPLGVVTGAGTVASASSVSSSLNRNRRCRWLQPQQQLLPLYPPLLLLCPPAASRSTHRHHPLLQQLQSYSLPSPSASISPAAAASSPSSPRGHSPPLLWPPFLLFVAIASLAAPSNLWLTSSTIAPPPLRWFCLLYRGLLSLPSSRQGHFAIWDVRFHQIILWIDSTLPLTTTSSTSMAIYCLPPTATHRHLSGGVDPPPSLRYSAGDRSLCASDLSQLLLPLHQH